MPSGYAIAPIMCIPVDEDVAIEDDMGKIEESFEVQLKKSRRAISVVSKTKYINLSFIKPDTNIVERLLSQTKKVWVNTGKSMTPAHMELLLLLKCNRDLWDFNLVYKSRTNPGLPPPVVNEDKNMEVEELGILEDCGMRPVKV